MNKRSVTTDKHLLFTLLLLIFSQTIFALHSDFNLMTCPDENMVPNGTSAVCSGEGTGSLVAWQNSINAANPLDATQDPDGLGSIVYSSVLPEAGITLPNDFLPTGVTTQSDNCIIENQSTSAYLYCDADANGAINGGDTYILLSSYSLLVYPEIQTPTITDNSCEITITGACPNDIITLSNQSISGGVITNNGTNEVTYTAADADLEGTVDIAIVSGISGSLCAYMDNIPTPDCPIEGCPIPEMVDDVTDAVCASGGVAGLAAWQQSIEDANPLDGNTDAGGFGEIVYSSVEPVPGGQAPDDKLPTGIFDGPDFCSLETQEGSAYLHCTQPGSESYMLLSTFTLIVYPPPMSVVVTMDGSNCGNPTVELHAANGDVCETLMGNCTINGTTFDYDFATTATGMALADAPVDCVLPAAGSIACSNCTNIMLTDDPCSCSDPLNFSSGPNYFFHEVIEISATAGQTWNLTGLTSGQLYDNTGAVLTYPLPLTDNMDDTYTISVWVLSELPYEATFQEMGGTTVSIGNSCALPDDIDVFCPANVELGPYDCTTLDAIIDCPSTLTELMAAPYNMTIDLNSFCGTPVILCDDDEDIDICDGDLTVIRFITVFDDFNGDGELDGMEPDVECEFTIELLGDEEEPEINEDEEELDMTICSTDPEATCFEDLAEDFFDDIEDLFIEDAEGSIIGILLTDPETGMTWTINAPTATDNCGLTITEFDEIDEEDDDDCFITYVIYWVVVDECGENQTDYEQFITFMDCAPPNMEEEAEDETISCDNPDANQLLADWLDDNGGAEAEDNCSDVDWSNDYSGMLTDNGCTQTATVVFTATDECDNESMTTATFTITDTEGPEITTGAMNQTISCDNADIEGELDDWLDNNGGAVAMDNCSFTWSNDYLFETDDGCSQTATVTFTATDDCDLTASTTATFTVTDMEAPMIGTAAMDETISCDNNDITGVLNIWLATQGGAVATDNCNFEWTNNFTALVDDGCSQTATVTFTATDDCDLTASTTATFTVTDMEAPMIGTEAMDQTISCDNNDITGVLNIWLATQGGAVATDNCNFEWTNNFTALADDGCSQTATVTFTATDDCDLTASTTATFTVTDMEAPMIGTEAMDQTISCDNNDITGVLNIWLATQGGAVATDNCNFDWTNNFTALADDGCSQTATVMFTATDDCDLSASTTATFTVTDMEAPMIGTVAMDQTISCDNPDITAVLNAWLDSQGGAVATDNCNFEWTNNFTALADDGCSQTATVTFRATDDCDLTASTTATFTVTDMEAPMIGAESMDETISCDNNDITGVLNIWLATQGGAVATDNCNFDWTNNFTAFADDGCSQTATVTFTATDDCDLMASTTATFTVTDMEAPMIGTEAMDQTISCDNNDITGVLNIWLATQGGAVATDNCNFEWTNNFTALVDDGCSQTATVTFTATDDCDLTASTTATFTVTDMEAPMIGIVAMDETISCDNPDITGVLNAWLDSQGGAIATDNCNFEWTNNFTALTDDGCSQTATVTFTATDDCDLTASATATFTVTDMEAPMIGTAAMDQTISCDNNDITGVLNTWLDSQGGAIATDNCNFEWTNNFTALVDDGCIQTATVTFTATDDCDLTASTTATFTVTDMEAPMIGTAAMDQTISCDNNDITGVLNAWLDSQGGAVATDNCNFEWTNNFTVLADDGCNQTATVTFTATDDCDLTASTTATFTVTDMEAPMIGTAAMDETISCDNNDITGVLNAWLNSQGGAIATDNCNFEWTNNFTALADDGCSQTATVMFTATDDCDLSASTTATFTVTDMEAPMIGTVAMDQTISCDNPDIIGVLNAWLDSQGGAVATDNCNFEWTNNFTALVDDGCIQTATVTFTATDDCDLTASTTATFTVTDMEAPMIGIESMDETISCDNPDITGVLTTWLNTQGGAVATDNCSLTWTNNFIELTGTNCSQSATVTFTATDDCGNSASTTATFSVVDNVGPVVVTPPNVTGLTCFENAGQPASTEAEYLAIGGEISDNCSTEFTVISQQTNMGDFCPNGMPFSIMRTYYITDECGNTTIAPTPHVIQYLESDTGPIITDSLATCYKYCGSLVNPMESDITYTTDCALGATVAITGPQIIGQENCDETIYRFTYTVTDECGRTDSATRSFIIGNNAPTIEAPPFNLIMECGNPDNADYIETHLGLVSVNASCGLDATISHSPSNFDDLVCGDSRVVTFTVTDACGRTATATTTIALLDTESPVFTTIPPPFCNEIPCSADVNAWYDHWLNYMIEGLEASDSCNPNPTIEGSNPDLNTVCIDGEAITVVNFVASDGCGNSATVTGTFTVLSVPPIFTFVPQDASIACGDAPVFGMATASDECGNVVVTFDDVEIGDNCTGMIVRTWTATNECGATATATTTVTFTNLPTEDPTASISGLIATEYQEAVSGVVVSLENSSGINLTNETEAGGTYLFSDLAMDNNYTVSPFLNENPLNGVSSYDMVLISKHILEIEPLDSPYKIIAADINGNGSVTTIDLVELRKLILHIDEEFANNTSWRFVEADYVFPNAENPFATIFPEEVYLNGLLPSEIHDFVGVKIGDVNNSVQANGLLEVEERSERGAMIMEVEDKLLHPGETHEVVFKLEDGIQLSAFQFSLNFDPAQLEFVEFSKGNLEDLEESNFGFSKLNEGGITSSWHTVQAASLNAGETLFKLTFIAKEMVRLSELLHVNSRFTKAEAYDAALNELNVKLRFNYLLKPNNTFALYDNKPNPFKESTIIGFHLPEAAETTIEIYDLSGRMIHRVKQPCDVGYNEMEISQSDLSTSGVYYYRLSTSGFEATKKMLLQRF